MNTPRNNIFQPLAMNDTRFLPPSHWRARIAPTEYDESHQMLRGTVHDPTARRMGGVAGHAGLFSTADDLAKYAQDMLTGFHVLSALTVEKMSTPQQPPTASSLRGLGWDIDSPFSSNRGEFLPVGSFGHTGFTGTSIWIDPVTNSYVIVLTNAVHPRGSNSAVVSLRARIASAVAQELELTVTEDQKLRLARITGYNEAMSAARLLTAAQRPRAHRHRRAREPRLCRTPLCRFAENWPEENQDCDRHQSNRHRRPRPSHHRCLGQRLRHRARRHLQSRARRQRKPGHHRNFRLPRRRHRNSRLQRLRRQQR